MKLLQLKNLFLKKLDRMINSLIKFNSMIKNLFFLFLLLFITNQTQLFSQQLEINSSVSASGYLSSEESIPFWMLSNQNGALSAESNGLFEAESILNYDLNENHSIEVGGSFFLRDEIEDEFQRNELYIQYSNRILKATIGSKNADVFANGLSVVNSNFLMAGNSRALPGITIEANSPSKISERFSIDWGIGHYELNDDRYVKDAMLHYKYLGLIWNVNVKNSVKGEIIHYAQWGGTSPESGDLPSSGSDFFDIFLSKRANEGTTSEQRNALGNHLGLYNFEYTYSPSSGNFIFYHQHPFEDGSGTRLANFYDGIWGFYFEPNTENFTTFINGLLVEFVDTSDQSSNSGFSGRDNYFNSGVYRSGWSYENNIIGLPFIYQDETGLVIANNRLRAVHIGLSASNKKWSYKYKLSLVENLGSYGVPFPKKQKAVYNYFQTQYDLEKLGKIILHLGMDMGEGFSDNYGAGLQYSYSF